MNMAEVESVGRLPPHGGVKKTSNGSVVSSSSSKSRLLMLQRKLRKVKDPAKTTQQQPNTVVITKKKLDGFLEKTQSKLTISTAETSCTSSLSQSHVNHSFDYPISNFPSQLGSDSYASGSKAEESFADSFATFALGSHAQEAAVLFKEWRSLYALSAENSEHYADDEADDEDEQTEDCPDDDETASHRPEAEEKEVERHVIIDGTPSDLAQLTIESSCETMTTVNEHIPTPPGTTSVPCSFNFDFFGGEMLKSVVKKMSQMAVQAIDDDSECSDDNSSCSGNSESMEENNNLIPNKLLHYDKSSSAYDEGETNPSITWTFDSSQA